MARGSLDSPNLDDRTWQDIVDQARALIPTYAPEWTDHNPSDLGMTLIELFAWLVEGMTYRLNRVPEKNLIEFLKLIGVTRAPAQPASAYLTYQINNTLPALRIPKGSQVATVQTETENGIVFETDEDLTALPLNLVNALLLQPASKQYTDVTSKVVGAPLAGLTTTIAADGAVLLALGFDRASTQPLITHWRFLQPVKDNAQAAISWFYAQGANLPLAWSAIPASNLADETKGFQQHGRVSLTIPGDWSSQNPKDWDFTPAPGTQAVEQQRFWIGVNIKNKDKPQTSPSPAFAFGLAHVLFNSVSATNALTISKPELLGTSNGKPFQTFALRYAPLYKNVKALDWYEHLKIQVRTPQIDGSFSETEWSRVEDFPEGEGTYYRLNPVTGVIDFGNFHPTTAKEGHGSIPPKGSEIRALTYRYVGGGANGNVPTGAINQIRTPLNGVDKVQNLGSTQGGVDEEPIEETKRRGPELLRNRYRAVTLEDYEFLAQEASPEVKKVSALSARFLADGTAWAFGGIARVPGSVNVIVVPEAPLETPRPMPSDKLLRKVSDFLEERRIITTTLHVTVPRYVPIKAMVNIQVWKTATDGGLISREEDFRSFKNEISVKINGFFHPIYGGLDGKGWEIGQDVTVSTLFEYIRPAPEIGLISSIAIIAAATDHTRNLTSDPQATAWVRLDDFELVCSADSHNVNVTEISQ